MLFNSFLSVINKRKENKGFNYVLTNNTETICCVVMINEMYKMWKRGGIAL